MSNNKDNKVIVILGTTASGKTKLGVELAYKYNGEIINADSRQVYKGMDVGTGKDLDEYRIEEKDDKGNKKIIDIPYHLIDVVHPNTPFNLAKYQSMAYQKIQDILSRGKLPIMVGGTGLYIQSVVEGFDLAGTGPDPEQRKELEQKDAPQLFQYLYEINSDFAERLNQSDKNNPRRLIRYIELCYSSDRPTPGKRGSDHDYLLLGITHNKEELNERIYKRLRERLEQEGMIEEVRRLHEKEKVSWKRLKQFGLEYKYVARYLQGELDHEDMVEKLFVAIRQFAKRQMTWFSQWGKKGVDIHWLQQKQEAEKVVDEFLEQGEGYNK